MIVAAPPDFAELRPRLTVLLDLHRRAGTDEARAELVNLFEDVFLATAWHIAHDLLENGWQPGFASALPSAQRGHLRLVEDDDAA